MRSINPASTVVPTGVFWKCGVANLRIAAVAGMLISPTGAWAAQQQFDLVCKGEATKMVGNSPVQPDGSWSKTLHVDLDAQLRCEQACAASFPIATVTPSEIIFRASGGTQGILGVNRTTGEYLETIVILTPGGADGRFLKGLCTVEPVTLKPKALF